MRVRARAMCHGPFADDAEARRGRSLGLLPAEFIFFSDALFDKCVKSGPRRFHYIATRSIRLNSPLVDQTI